MKKLIFISIIAFFTVFIALAQEATEIRTKKIDANQIEIQKKYSDYIEIVDGEYYIKSKNTQIIFNVKIRNKKQCDKYIGFITSGLKMYDEDGFAIGADEVNIMKLDSTNSDAVNFLRTAEGNEITLRFIRNFGGNVKYTIKEIMDSNIAKILILLDIY